jgi:hypothetical protein
MLSEPKFGYEGEQECNPYCYTYCIVPITNTYPSCISLSSRDGYTHLSVDLDTEEIISKWRDPYSPRALQSYTSAPLRPYILKRLQPYIPTPLQR